MEGKAMVETVKALPHTFVAQDLSVVEMEFEFESGARQTLRFDMGLFEQFMGRAAQLIATARSRTLTKGDHLEVHVLQAVHATATAPVGGGRVLLSVIGDNGIPLTFGLSPDLADQLRPELHRASRDAKKQVSQSRH